MIGRTNVTLEVRVQRLPMKVRRTMVRAKDVGLFLYE